jgi:hypothetical protein
MAAHSEFGASAAYRWMACPGSVSMSRGIANTSSFYAEEGTAAHELGELAIKTNGAAAAYIGAKAGNGVEYTEEMAEAVQVYVDWARGMVLETDDWGLERRGSLERLHPPAPMFGTADFVLYRRAEKLLVIGDYKHGQGVPVEVENNSQLRYYALAQLLGLPDDAPCERVDAYIIQPRAPHADGPVRCESFRPGDLLDYATDLTEGVEAALAPDAALVPGGHCRFCPALALCPAKRDAVLTAAQDEFNPPALRDVRLLTAEQVGELLARAGELDNWVTALRAQAQTLLAAGQSVPGWKLVAKRAIRKWTCDAETVAARLPGADVWEAPAIKSPAQIEKLVGKKAFPADLVAAVSSGETLAPVADKRPPVVAQTAADDFAAIEKTEETL